MTPAADGPRMPLIPLTAAGVRQIEHWFDDPEVRAHLGGRPWIHRELRLLGERPGSEFRGATVLRSYGWIGLDGTGAPAVFIGGDVYDRWVQHGGEGPDGPLRTVADPRPAMGLAYLADPAARRRGHTRAALRAVLAHPATADVATFFCGIEPANTASRRCAVSAGFTLLSPAPDFEGMLYYYARPRP